MRPGWPEAVVAVSFVGFAGLALWLGVEHDQFADVWAGVGTVVGIVVGVIPGYFFAQKAQQTATAATRAADTAQAQAATAEAQVKSLLRVTDETVANQAKDLAPQAWGA